MEGASNIRKIAFLGNGLRRKCGLAWSTTNELAIVRRGFQQAQAWSWARREVQRYKGKAGD